MIIQKNSKRKQVDEPVLIMPSKDFVMAACSRKHTFLVTVTGQLYAAGTSSAGELGVFADQSQYEVDSPLPVQGVGRVSDVASADEHTLAVAYDSHELFGWGNQVNGRLGLGSNSQATVNTARPVPVLKDGAKTKFVGVACGKDFSMALDADGFVWFAGVKRHEVSASTSSYLEGSLISTESNQFVRIQEKGRKYEYIFAASTFAIATEKNGGVVFLGDKRVMHSAEYLRRYGESKTFIGCIQVLKVPVQEHSHYMIPGLTVSCNVELFDLGK